MASAFKKKKTLQLLIHDMYPYMDVIINIAKS